MRISIIHTKGRPFKAYLDNKTAIKEYERLRNLDDYVDYSLIEMPIEDSPHNKPVEPTAKTKRNLKAIEENTNKSIAELKGYK